MPVVWTKHPRTWRNNAQFVMRALQGVAQEVLEKRKDEITAFLKANAPWTDRTGNARASLQARVVPGKLGTDARLIMTYGSDIFYWVFLEFSNAGAYSILPHAVDVWGPILKQDLQEALNARR